MGIFQAFLIVQMRTMSQNASHMQGVLQKSISDFEGQHPTFSFNKSHQIHTNGAP